MTMCERRHLYSHLSKSNQGGRQRENGGGEGDEEPHPTAQQAGSADAHGGLEVTAAGRPCAVQAQSEPRNSTGSGTGSAGAVLGGSPSAWYSGSQVHVGFLLKVVRQHNSLLVVLQINIKQTPVSWPLRSRNRAWPEFQKFPAIPNTQPLPLLEVTVAV